MKISQIDSRFYFTFAISLFVWAVVFFSGYSTAIDVWTVSEIYNHCFFVIPCSFYFIYRNKNRLLATEFSISFIPLIFIVPILVLQLFAQVGDINVLMHIATFSSLPLLIWMLIGTKAAKVIAYPLCFMLFAIPIGDQIVPYLQDITTDLAVPLLKLTNVPVYRNGLYLDIPEGQFLVAEACSGISFLISSIVFGFFYAYISFQSKAKRALFIGMSIGIPIVANAIRVYGIILTGHLTNMEHAVGADHLVYGGVFFGIVLFILILIGERFRDKNVVVDTGEIQLKSSTTLYFWPKSLVFLVCALMQQVWLYQINHKDTDNLVLPENVEYSLATATSNSLNLNWKPKYNGASKTVNVTLQDANYNFDVFFAFFTGVEGELVSSSHRLFIEKEWSQVSNKTITLTGINKQVKLTEIVSSLGKKRFLAHWYEVAGMHLVSDSKTKLMQAYRRVLGLDSSGAKFIVSFEVPMNESEDTLQSFVTKQYEVIRASLYKQVKHEDISKTH